MGVSNIFDTAEEWEDSGVLDFIPESAVCSFGIGSSTNSPSVTPYASSPPI